MALSVFGIKLNGLAPKTTVAATPSNKTAKAPTEVRLTTDQASFSNSPRTFYRGISEGSSTQWTSDDLSAWPAQDMSATRPSFSLKDLWNSRAAAAYDDGVAVTFDISAALASQVGKYMSYSERAWFYGAEQRGTRETTLRTVDMTTGKPASLSDIFPKEAIYQALMKDPIVQKTLAGAKPANLEQLTTALEGKMTPDHTFKFPEANMLEQFAFDHVNGNQVAVRLALPGGIQAADSFMKQVGIYLPIPASLSKALASKDKIVTTLGADMGYPFDYAQSANNPSKLTSITIKP